MPLPCNVMPFVIESVEVQVAVPAGTTTVSPLAAKPTAVLTAAKDAFAAVIVAASVQLKRTKAKLAARAMRPQMDVSIFRFAKFNSQSHLTGDHYKRYQTKILKILNSNNSNIYAKADPGESGVGAHDHV